MAEVLIKIVTLAKTQESFSFSPEKSFKLLLLGLVEEKSCHLLHPVSQNIHSETSFLKAKTPLYKHKLNLFHSSCFSCTLGKYVDSCQQHYYKANCFCDSLVSVSHAFFQKDDPLCKQGLKRPTEAREEGKRISPNRFPKGLAFN